MRLVIKVKTKNVINKTHSDVLNFYGLNVGEDKRTIFGLPEDFADAKKHNDLLLIEEVSSYLEDGNYSYA